MLPFNHRLDSTIKILDVAVEHFEDLIVVVVTVAWVFVWHECLSGRWNEQETLA